MTLVSGRAAVHDGDMPQAWLVQHGGTTEGTDNETCTPGSALPPCKHTTGCASYPRHPHPSTPHSMGRTHGLHSIVHNPRRANPLCCAPCRATHNNTLFHCCTPPVLSAVPSLPSPDDSGVKPCTILAAPHVQRTASPPIGLIVQSRVLHQTLQRPSRQKPPL